MSFALTEAQLLAGAKDVTRRLGWQNLRVGETVVAIRKGMGLAKGEKQVVLGTIQITSVRREPLCRITQDDCRREGFPNMTPNVFVIFFAGANGCQPDAEVTRIEFQFSRTPPDPAETTRQT
jgi:hypothetical protein